MMFHEQVRHTSLYAQHKRAQLQGQHRYVCGVLQRAYMQHIKLYGPNPAFGPANAWGDTPRSGAKWSEAEDEALMNHVTSMIRVDIHQISVRELCNLAWEHGRSAIAIDSRLEKLLGYVKYQQLVQIF